MKKIALIAASLAVFAAPALAEDAKTVGNAPAEAKFSSVSKDEMFSSKLKGLNVYNQKDESIGEITDLAIKNHQVDALILSVGGFLGMGEHLVAIPYDKLKFVNQAVAYNGTGANNNAATNTAANRPASTTTTTGAATGTDKTATATTSSSKWYPDHAVFNASKDELKNMPEFKYSE